MEDCASLGYDRREYLFRLGRVQLGLWLVQRIGAAFCQPILSLPLARLLPFTIPTGRLSLAPPQTCIFRPRAVSAIFPPVHSLSARLWPV